MEQLGRRVTEWRAIILDKGLNVNAGKSKVVVSSIDGKMIVNSGKWPCGVCGKGVHANSVQCTVCINWIHTRCGGVCGDLSLVADGFRCKQCDGTIQDADLAGDLVVDGDTHECVKSFCYLGDTLDEDGGADLTDPAIIINGWMNCRELMPFLISKAPPLEMKGRITPVIRSGRLRWYAHVMRKSDENCVKKCMKYKVEGRRPVGRSRRVKSVEADMAELEITKMSMTERNGELML